MTYEGFRLPEGYIRFDEREDVLASLDLLKLITPLLERNPAYWKWVVVAAQSALQGAMVCALCDSTRTSFLTKKSQVEQLNWLQANDVANRGDQPKEVLASFNELLSRCQDKLGLSLIDEQLRDIKRLHTYFRNRFAHFTPIGWGIHKAGLPRIVGAALYAVEDLMSRPNPGVHLNASDQNRLKAALKASRANLGI